MKTIIKNLFTYHHFSSIELPIGELFFTSNNERKYYWLVVQTELLPEILQKQDEWFEKCQQKIKDKDFAKNASLLILTTLRQPIDQKKDILKIEEDPFQFKKMVLLYTEESTNELKERSNGGLAEHLLGLLIDEGTFNAYKQDKDGYNWKNLLYHIGHKLPFLKINVATNQDLKNLWEKNENDLSNVSLLEFFNQIDTKIGEEKISTLENLTTKEWISLLEQAENEH